MRRYVFLILIFGFLGCAKNRVVTLTERADAYNRGLRWSSLTAITPLIVEENRRSVIERLSKDLGQNRIVDYSIVDLGLDDKKKSGSLIVEFSFYGISDQDLRYRQELQAWRYDSERKTWFLQDFRPLN